MLDFAQYESYRIYTDVFIPSERSAFLVGRIATAPEARDPSFLIRRTGSVIIKNPPHQNLYGKESATEGIYQCLM